MISPNWGKQTEDNHQRVFYESIDGGYDAFINSEEDENIRLVNMLAFMQETEKLQKLVGGEVSMCIVSLDTSFCKYSCVRNQELREREKERVFSFVMMRNTNFITCNYF